LKARLVSTLEADKVWESSFSSLLLFQTGQVACRYAAVKKNAQKVKAFATQIKSAAAHEEVKIRADELMVKAVHVDSP
jgi:hypothetical protein